MTERPFQRSRSLAATRHPWQEDLMGVQTSAYLRGRRCPNPPYRSLADGLTSVTHPARMVRAVCGVARIQRP